MAQMIFRAHSSHPIIVRRVLTVMASAGRVAMAAGGDLPDSAERAFDASGGVAALASVVRRAMHAADGVVIEAALRTLAGTRLHTKERVEQARPLPLLLTDILTVTSGSAAVMEGAVEAVVAVQETLTVTKQQAVTIDMMVVAGAVPLTIPAAAASLLESQRPSGTPLRGA